ncbi:MAG: ABC transporter ATP-binding protein [Candidatus Melainabacteria bacterium]|nr:ABC transporter ATP-binding protein [Candidatus Melainabacteria bacterium]
MNNSVISLENISLSLPIKLTKEKFPLIALFKSQERKVLDDIGFSALEGECIGLIGKSGSGKTVLLKTIAGIFYPLSGRLKVRRKVFPLFGVGGCFNERLNAYENIYFYASLLGASKKLIRGKIQDIISFSGLKDYAYEELRDYSSGMKMKLAFSTISFLNPEIFFVDESYLYCDAAFLEKTLLRIQKLLKNNSTIIITSHSKEVLKKACKRGIVLDKGTIAYDGGIDEALLYYEKNLINAN